LPEFEQKFDDLVDLLCWSAKEGDHTGRDEQFTALRRWFLENFDSIRPYLLNHLVTLPEDAAVVYEGHQPPRDAFESLFLPRDVDSIIESETVICRIIRARAAVDALRNEVDSRVCF
jgi:hypothetical protein